MNRGAIRGAVLAVLEYIPNPKLNKFLRQGRRETPARYEGNGRGKTRAFPRLTADFKNKESSFLGHTVDALVLTGDEGRGKLR